MNGTSIASQTTLGSPGLSRSVAVGDFNGDGNPDILFQNVDGTPMIYTMNGTSVAATALLPDPGDLASLRRSATSTATARPTYCSRTATARRRSG